MRYTGCLLSSQDQTGRYSAYLNQFRVYCWIGLEYDPGGVALRPADLVIDGPAFLSSAGLNKNEAVRG